MDSVGRGRAAGDFVKANGSLRSTGTLEVQPVPHLRVNLPRLGVMRTPEGLAVIEEEAPVRQVESCHAHSHSFGKAPGYRQIECSMPFQVGPGDIAQSVREPRAVINISVRSEA